MDTDSSVLFALGGLLLGLLFLADGPPYVDTVEIKSPVSYTFQGRVVGREFGVVAEAGEGEEHGS